MSQAATANWPAPTDPYTACYQAFAKRLIGSTYLTGTCGLKLGNLNVWCDGELENLSSAKPSIQEGDVPEITLVQGVAVPRLINSKAWESSITISVVALTKTMQVSKINQIKHGVFGAIVTANIEENWTYSGNKFIRDYTINSISDGTSGIQLPTFTEAQRGMYAEGFLMSVTFNIYGSRADLPS